MSYFSWMSSRKRHGEDGQDDGEVDEQSLIIYSTKDGGHLQEMGGREGGYVGNEEEGSSSCSSFFTSPSAFFKNKDRRDLIAFFLSGLLNNFGYVVFLSAAEDLVPEHSGAVLLANILPTLSIKLTAPFFMQKIPYAFVLSLSLSSSPLSFFSFLLSLLLSSSSFLTFLSSFSSPSFPSQVSDLFQCVLCSSFVSVSSMDNSSRVSSFGCLFRFCFFWFR
jgi:hypothetical protein